MAEGQDYTALPFCSLLFCFFTCFNPPQVGDINYVTTNAIKWEVPLHIGYNYQIFCSRFVRNIKNYSFFSLKSCNLISTML